MSHLMRLMWVSIICFGLLACSGKSDSTPSIPLTTPPAIPTIQNSTSTPMIPRQTTTTIPDEPTPSDPIIFPFSEPGPYWTGKREFTLVDASRDERNITITIWYPTVQPQDVSSNSPVTDALPDFSNAPYPLILSSSKVGYIFAPHLVSYGFVYVGINGLDTYKWNKNLINQPLDILFALQQVASSTPDGLEGMIDSEHAGVMGYSFDGYNSLALSGARVDPKYYLEFCGNPSLDEHWIEWGYCEPANTWEDYSDLAGRVITTSNDGLWQPITDERIRAVMPMAPDGAILFGDRGLSSVDRPILIIGATDDGICNYNLEAVYIYEHIIVSDRTLISFVGEGHMMIFDDDQVIKMKHFAVAFFGYHLQGNKDYAYNFSEEFVTQYDDLAWGVYNGE